MLILVDFTLFLGLLFFYSNELCHGRWLRKLRKLLKKPLIGIIREDECHFRATNFTPEDWKNFMGENYKYKFITTLNIREISDEYVAIINPYGECYPEKDILEKLSFRRIKEYVKNGGIFLSTAGCAFWFAWNRLSLGAPSTAKEVYSYAGVMNAQGSLNTEGNINLKGNLGLQHVYSPIPAQSLTETLTFKELGMLTTTGEVTLTKVYQKDDDEDIEFFGDLVNVGEIDFIFEFRAIRKPVQSCVPMLRAKIPTDIQPLEVYPLASVPCGEGHFIFTGMAMNVTPDKPIIIVDDESEPIFGCITDEEAISEISQAQAQKVCEGLNNLIQNEKVITKYLKQRR